MSSALELGESSLEVEENTGVKAITSSTNQNGDALSKSMSPNLLARPRKETVGVLPPLESLKCNLCTDLLVEPVTLQCLHSFCRKCLEDYNQEHYGEISKESIEIEEQETKEDSGEPAQNPILCSVCRNSFSLDLPEEPSAPFENSRLARIVGLVESDHIVCQNCSDTTSEMKCETCSAWLCVSCMESTHSAPIFKSHNTERLSHDRMMAPPKCSQHPLNDLEFFSTEEEMGVCQVCLLKGEFVGKPYCLVSDVRKLRQEDIENELEKVLEQREKFVAGKLAAEGVMQKLDENLLKQTTAVKKNFEAIRKALERREAQTLEALIQLKQAKDSILQKQLDQVENIINVIDDGVDNVETVLNHSNNLELVYLTVVLQDFVSDLTKLDAKRFTNGTLDMPYYHAAAVDEELPVLLSERVPQLVSAYASVPSADELLQSSGTPKIMPTAAKVTKEQKAVLEEVSGAKTKAEEYGCSLQ